MDETVQRALESAFGAVGTVDGELSHRGRINQGERETREARQRSEPNKALQADCLQRPLRSRFRQQLSASVIEILMSPLHMVVGQALLDCLIARRSYGRRDIFAQFCTRNC